ncbi:uncharacterized protein (TIGR02246 family) [Pseudomonas hunanensis]|uniref:Uncharacterized protein (TIGR02246 family) n=1 Tax=Pseudomonas hunanensis TaxID=1247546 RepID=A0ACC6K5H5_9PSED|nr:SgcJ/EcaC family oxidoreductase [Pseudomonas hunanensis]MDR6713678.1 uncharacterized protein (TIGR02246 family) [Pseudomonas hunanensis]
MQCLKYFLAVPLMCLSMTTLANARHCQAIAKADALSLFQQWNASLQTGDPAVVARLYASNAVLLPTVSSQPRLTQDERIDYFRHFLADRPSGALDTHHVSIGCDKVTLSGLYTFAFAASGKQVPARYTFVYVWDGEQWLISHHHSSSLPAG